MDWSSLIILDTAIFIILILVLFSQATKAGRPQSSALFLSPVKLEKIRLVKVYYTTMCLKIAQKVAFDVYIDIKNAPKGPFGRILTI